MGIVKPGNYGILGKKRIFFRGYARLENDHRTFPPVICASTSAPIRQFRQKQPA
jgi:hypothetical protein